LIDSAKMHMVPANDAIADRIAEVTTGDLIALKGFLIQAEQGNGWKWRSSLTRSDTGAKSCELVWVDDFKILNR
jgi:hypothetical protein